MIARHASLRALLLVSLVPVSALYVVGQGSSPWRSVDEARLMGRGERRITPTQYRTIGVDLIALNQVLSAAGEMDVRSAPWTISLPKPEEGLELFQFVEAPVMHPELGARYPEIRTYAGISLERPGMNVRFDLTPHGFHAMVMDPHEGMYFIDPYSFGVDDACIVYRKSDFQKVLPADHVFCSYEEVNELDKAGAPSSERFDGPGQMKAGDCQKRTYRLALACTGEYANYHGSNTTNNNKSFALAAMVTSMNRVNGIYERDATLTMTMIANNDQIVYLNASTDPYTNGNGGTMLGQNQTTCNAVIGAANYDIGHVFSTGGGGVAQLNSPCTSSKARGVTGSGNPVGDPFDIDYVAHEMGHQFGANHTQNNNCNRASNAAFEPGSASTIMGYAGICSPNVQSNSDALFHAYSLQEIATFLAGTGGNCPQTQPSGNQAPTVSAGPNRTIPRSTPFILTATASDPDPNTQLTYTWEQMNNQVSTQPPVATSTGGPNFRALLPSTSPSRYLPNLNAVVANTNPTWEVLSSVGRTFNFRVMVRDNNSMAGCNAESNMTVTVNSGSGPFLVTQPNTNLSWQAGSQQTVTWNVANTTASPVSCSSVDILLSVDGGYTYPHTLITATSNDGSQTVTLPVVSATNTARVMVRANGNIFYDISNTNFTLSAAPIPPTLSAKMIIEGPYDESSGLMKDDLRQAGLVPLVEPYTALEWVQVGGGGGETTTAGVLGVLGDNAIVDWVRVELRPAASSGSIVATRQALLQRDGDIVATDGVSPITFNLAGGNYFVSFRHRNHLGCMTASSISFGGATVTLDMRTFATNTFGVDARKDVSGNAVLWLGNVIPDDRILYTGSFNDRDPLLVAIGAIPTNTVSGYRPEDVNLDGIVKYTGSDNDRDGILVNIGGTIPTNNRLEQLP